MTSDARWTHLHVHSEHSPLDGMVKFKAAVEKVKAEGGNALAITDHGNTSGAWKFAKVARDAGIKPIIGIEAYLALASDWRDEPDRHDPGTVETERDDETSAELDEQERGKAQKKTTKTKRNQHITLLAKNREGWHNLVRMQNAATNSYGGRFPLMDFKLIKQHSEGIIALTGCLGGPVLGPVSRGEMDEAERNLERIIDAVGRENVYVEIMEHGIAAETAALPVMADLAAKHGLQLVATNDAHYTREGDTHAHEAWCAIQSDSTLDDPKRFRFHGTGYWLRSEEEMRALRDEDWWQQAITNAGVVAERCDDVIPPTQMRLPAYDVPAEFPTARRFLVHLAKEGVKVRFPGEKYTQAVKDRLNEELTIVSDMGFIDYYLIVWDVINWCRRNGIRVGPGRGSAAGSLLSYCLFLVQVDPLENNLLFERFLEPGREGMPDMDLDFQQNRRGEVLEYLAQRWGRDRVARIGSFSAHKTRRALRDAGKLLGLPSIGDKLSKAVPVAGGKPYSFDQLADTDDMAGERFRQIQAEYGDDGEKVVALAAGFADTINGESIHACGTLICDTDLTDLIPLRRDRKMATSSGLATVTQWDGVDIDAFGLLKLDVLGLRNLDVVSKAVEYIEATTGEVIDTDKLPHPNDHSDARVRATWELLRSGRTAGIFQMESDGMAKLAQAVEPDCLTDLSAIVALYRPGPMGNNMHTMYAERKAGRQAVDYSMYSPIKAEQEAIATVLDDTYGVFVFQEQLMRLGTVISGFTAAQRSKLRKAVGKKKKDVMEQVGQELVAGAPVELRDDNGDIISIAFRPETATRVYDYMKASAEYLFNASHSAAYAYLAYITAYLKASWPAEYGAAILATTSADDKRQAALRALREEGIEVLAPDVNRSRGETFPIGPTSIILGLSEIKGVGQAGSDIAANREAHGPFASIHEMMNRVTDEFGKSIANTRVVEGLAEAGALDVFGSRLGILRVRDGLMRFNLPIPADEWGVLERSRRQRARLGVIMGTHPLDVPSIAEQVSQWRTTDLGGRSFGEGRPAEDLRNLPDENRQSFLAFGVIAKWGERAYKGGQMANFTIENSSIALRGVIWDKTLRAIRDSDGGVPSSGQIIALSGQVQINEREVTDEDDNVVEVVTTKEVMGSKVWHIDVDDPVTAAPVAGEVGWREFLTIAGQEPVIEIPELPAAAPAEPQQPEETAATVLPTDDSGLIVGISSPASARTITAPQTLKAFLRRHGKTLEFTPPRSGYLDPAPGVAVASLRGEPRAVIAYIPSAYAKRTPTLPPGLTADAPLPPWWEFVGFTRNPDDPDAEPEADTADGAAADGAQLDGDVAAAVHDKQQTQELRLDGQWPVADEPWQDLMPFDNDEWGNPNPPDDVLPEPEYRQTLTPQPGWLDNLDFG
ncbi:DNA polymerase III subunit alpha [Curtobacterium sp. MCBD17_040]|uniref:DNA polymerase III subunit alpha n=1 Tax=Curtobacterium sp. MCBD17_040 TaxID=2175674 RepID=UPI0015E88C24|nr:DNA polymerase III subunit alpha [Curtobacterium sp. MCBD17_040]WIB65464.1 DNA polymerase III subunit alpha [Curtobacterium sp. MCBD17_040]